MFFAVIGLLCGCGGDESDPVDPVNPNPGTEHPEEPDPNAPDNPDNPDPDDSDNQYNPEPGDPVSLVGQWELVKTERYASDGKLLDSSYFNPFSLRSSYTFNETDIFKYAFPSEGQYSAYCGFYTYDTDTQLLEMDNYDYGHISITASYFDHVSDAIVKSIYPNIDGLMRLIPEADENGNQIVEYYRYASSSLVGLPKKEDLIFIDIPDANFKSYLLRNCDPNRDGRISVSEAAQIAGLYINSKDISSLESIEYCTLLTKLECNNNQLTTLDLSKNTGLWVLECSDNQLTTLDVSQHTQLMQLYCDNNRLTMLDVKSAPLYQLRCHNNQLTNLDISRKTELTNLWCHGNQLKSIDVSRNTALTDLNCSDNRLTSLDVSHNTALWFLSCSDNQLTTLDVSQHTQLTQLDCSNNQLITLNVDKTWEMEELDCSGNQLTTLDVSNCIGLDGLRKLDCSDNQLTTLDVSRTTELYCRNNKLKSLNTSGIEKLYCSDNQLTTLDVSNNPALTHLECYNNQLTMLDVSNCKNLQYLKLNPMPSLKSLYMESGQEIKNMQIPSTTKIYYKYK